MPYLDEIIARLEGEPRFVLVARADGSEIARFLMQRLAHRKLSVQSVQLEAVSWRSSARSLSRLRLHASRRLQATRLG